MMGSARLSWFLALFICRFLTSRICLSSLAPCEPSKRLNVALAIAIHDSCRNCETFEIGLKRISVGLAVRREADLRGKETLNPRCPFKWCESSQCSVGVPMPCLIHVAFPCTFEHIIFLCLAARNPTIQTVSM